MTLQGFWVWRKTRRLVLCLNLWIDYLERVPFTQLNFWPEIRVKIRHACILKLQYFGHFNILLQVCFLLLLWFHGPSPWQQWIHSDSLSTWMLSCRCQCFGAEDKTHGTNFLLFHPSSDRNDLPVAGQTQTKWFYICLSLNLCPEITLTCLSSTCRHPSTTSPDHPSTPYLARLSSVNHSLISQSINRYW